MKPVLADTSVWVRHFREGDPCLERLLLKGEVMCHPFIIGELACGNLKNRREIISLLQHLPQAALIKHDEILHFIAQHHLMGKGLGYIDVHLSASAMVMGVPMWTFDQRLDEANKLFGIRYQPGYTA
jgi:predicted nucleic acid-binding protein